MLNIIFQYGWAPVIIHRILIGFEAILEITFQTQNTYNKAALTKKNFQASWTLCTTPRLLDKLMRPLALTDLPWWAILNIDYFSE